LASVTSHKPRTDAAYQQHEAAEGHNGTEDGQVKHWAKIIDGPVHGQRAPHREMDKQGQQPTIPHAKGIGLGDGHAFLGVASGDHIANRCKIGPGKSYNQSDQAACSRKSGQVVPENNTDTGEPQYATPKGPPGDRLPHENPQIQNIPQ